MRQVTIAERLFAPILPPLAVILAVPYLSAALPPFPGESHYGWAVMWLIAAGLAGAAVLAIARGIARPLGEAADALDAIAYAELQSAAPLPSGRSEISRLIVTTERLAEVLGERQRRELVHNDLDRTWQASRRVNLFNLARQVESATERGIQPIVAGAVKADLREYPRYEVEFAARLERGGVVADVAVRDVSEGGARIVAADNFAIGDQVALTFPGMKAIAGTIVRNGGDNLGTCFTPSRLRPEELRDLVTSEQRAA